MGCIKCVTKQHHVLNESFPLFKKTSSGGEKNKKKKKKFNVPRRGVDDGTMTMFCGESRDFDNDDDY